MASIQETTSIQLRKGNTAENLAFTGAIAEVSADLGADSTGTDINTTLRLHNGVIPGGIPMARADLTNVTTKTLASSRDLYGDKNLAYADLSNIEELEDTDQQHVVRDYMHTYGLALNSQIEELDESKANRTMDNVDTSTLATGEGEAGKHSGKNLAYADMSNVTTVDLATSTGHGGKNLAYYDLTNINTTNLVAAANTRPSTMSGPVIANADLSNVADNTIKERLNGLDVEYITNKKTSINPESTSTTIDYPTTGAVIEYVEDELNKLDYMNPNFDNASTWDPLYSEAGTKLIYNNDVDNFTATGSDFTTTSLYKETNIPAIIPTNESLSESVLLKMAVYTLQAYDPDKPQDEGKPEIIRVYPEFGLTQLASQNVTFVNSTGSKATARLVCTPHPTLSGVYHYSIGLNSSNVVGQDGSRNTSSGWASNNSTDIHKVPCYNNVNGLTVVPVLTAQVKSVANGHITSFVFDPEVGPEMATSKSITFGHPFNVTTEDDPVTTDVYPIPEIQTGNNATFNLIMINDSSLPIIGGANVLKRNLENLPGMTALDIIENANASWSINKTKPVPAITSSSIDSAEYNRLATIGQVWDCARSIDSRIIFRKWSD